MTVRAVVLTEDPNGPSARHRWAYPAPYFLTEKIEVEIHPVQPKSVRAAAFDAAAAADLTIIHRKLFRAPDLHRLRRAGVPLVYDLDDAVMYRSTGRRRLWSLMRGMRFLRTMRMCVLYFAGNRYLLDRAPRRVPTALRPTPVDLPRYRAPRAAAGRGRVVGWIGTPSTLAYLLGISRALRELAGRREDLVLRVIGPEPPEVEGVTVEHVPWSEGGEADALNGLDVGILPLPDDRWTRGKCAFKALQYMAAGLPVVASPVGMNREVVADGESGILAGPDEEWVGALDRLLDDPELRRSMGGAGRLRVEESYATEAETKRTVRSLRSVLR